MTVSIMVEPRRTAGGGRNGRIAWWTGAAFVGLVAPITAGFTLAHLRHAPDMGWSRSWAMQIGLVAVLAIGVAALVRWRHLAASTGAPKPPSVRANHRLLGWSGALGGAMGLSVAFVVARQGGVDEHPDLLSADLPPAFAAALALIWGTVLPVISFRWQRVIDEHERDAYRDGAVAGYYAVAIGAPVWWFLWRGGLAPAVDALWLFTAMMIASGGVWMWRKYR